MQAPSACPLPVLGQHRAYASPGCWHKTRTRPLHSKYKELLPSLYWDLAHSRLLLKTGMFRWGMTSAYCFCGNNACRTFQHNDRAVLTKLEAGGSL